MSRELKPILAVPACEPGRGGGHLVRCMSLVTALRTLSRDAFLFLPEGDRWGGTFVNSLLDQNWLIDEKYLHTKKWGCVVLDRFQTPPEELERWSRLAPVIGIDEGGASRNWFDFLIDILPGCYRSEANVADVSLLPLPEKPSSKNHLTEAQGTRRPQRNSKFIFLLRVLRALRASVRDSLETNSILAGPFRVLISFGQEDAAGLGFAVARALAQSNDGSMEISLLRGGLGNNEESLGDIKNSVNIIATIPDLVFHLTEYDLVITHYGITAFEALYMSVPVLLVSPAALHEKLAKAAGFYSLGVGKNGANKLKRLLFNKGAINRPFLDRLKDRCSALAAKYNLDQPPRQSLAELINGFAPDVSRNCPACGAVLNSPALARYAERTYYRCARCGIIAMNRLNPPPIEYGKEYFFEQYQKQYGKTYIEDFPNLTALAKRRLAVIKKNFKTSHGGHGEARRTRGEEKGFNTSGSPRLLDIGCAYGPFLAAAREEGFSPCGIDPAEDAVRYVTETLGIPAAQGFFPNVGSGEWGGGIAALGSGEYDVVTLWYVIEHFRDCVPVLAEIRKLFKSGGVLAFATPSSTGISGRASLKGFLERSPADHWMVWSPASAKKVLATAGFAVKKIVNSGHHPERFPALGKYARSRKSPLYWLLLAVSKIFSLGDTFEVYAVGKSTFQQLVKGKMACLSPQNRVYS